VQIFKPLTVSLLMLSQVLTGSIMENDSNPALIDIYQKALLMRESSGNYNAKHKPSVIPDSVTGKPIRVQGLGGYGVLDINYEPWAKQAGLNGFNMKDGDWQDPKVQDRIVKYKLQQYFNMFGSWEAVSVAWFAGPNVARRLINSGTINFDKADSNGTTIKQYVDSMNNLVSEELMTMEVPMETFEPPQIYFGPQKVPVVKESRDNNAVYAAQILDALTRANSSNGVRPNLKADFQSQVPEQVGSFEGTEIKTNIRRGEQ